MDLEFRDLEEKQPPDLGFTVHGTQTEVAALLAGEDEDGSGPGLGVEEETAGVVAGAGSGRGGAARPVVALGGAGELGLGRRGELGRRGGGEAARRRSRRRRRAARSGRAAKRGGAGTPGGGETTGRREAAEMGQAGPLRAAAGVGGDVGAQRHVSVRDWAAVAAPTRLVRTDTVRRGARGGSRVSREEGEGYFRVFF